MMNKGLPKINIRKDESGVIRVSFSSYQSILVKKIKNIKGGRWHPDEKYWSFPNTNGIFTKILSSVDIIKHKAILMLIYSAGLRVGEVVKLKPEDIDSKRMLIHIKGSKGRKDRYTILS